MANKEFDKYREALVIETRTIWPDEFADLDEVAKARVALLRAKHEMVMEAEVRG